MALRLLFLFLILCANRVAVAANAVRVIAGEGVAAPKQYEISEWVVDPGATYQNPFNPSEIAIDAVFTGPGGVKMTMPAFWDEPGRFVVRFSPTVAGEWAMAVTVKDAAGSRAADAVRFTAQAATDNPGFVRRATNQNKNRYFVFDSGKTCFLLGLNLAWSPRKDPAEYEKWFRTLHEAGGNYARVWFNHAYPLETNKIPLGRYDLKAARFYDKVFQAAAAHHIYLMLTLNNYRELIGGDFFGDADWPTSPYNTKNGGPLKDPMDFFSNRQVESLYHQRLRYLVGRYAAFTSLALWEFWNEQDHLPPPGLPTEWLSTQSFRLRTMDSYEHLMTTSYSWKDRDDVWNLPAMDLTQRHMYGIGDKADFTQEIVKNAARYAKYEKPHLIGEFGINWKEPDIRHDPRGTGIALHNAIWATAMSGNAGSAATWWWDNYFVPKDLWHVFTGLSVFLRDVDLANAHFQVMKMEAAGVEVVGMQDATTGALLAWIHDPVSNWQNDLAGKEPAELDGVVLKAKMPKGTFRVVWVDTRTGKVVREEEAVSEGSEMQFTAPRFVRDVALRVDQAH